MISAEEAREITESAWKRAHEDRCVKLIQRFDSEVSAAANRGDKCIHFHATLDQLDTVWFAKLLIDSGYAYATIDKGFRVKW